MIWFLTGLGELFTIPGFEVCMRWILLCLISFNLFYFGWKQFLVEPKSPIVVSQQVDDQQYEGLVMLKELLPAAGRYFLLSLFSLFTH